MNKNTFINDYTDYNKRYIIIIIILSTILAIILGIYITKEFILKKDNINNSNINSFNKETTPPKEELPQEEVTEKDILWASNETEEDKKYEVYIKDNTLYINEDIIEKNIKKYLNVKIGGDVCEGNTYIINLKEDNTIGALSIDSLSCENEVEYTNKVEDLENIKDIYYKPQVIEDDVLLNNIYAETEENTIIINDYLSLK